MSDTRLPAIPQPDSSVESLLTSVMALKQAVEMLTGASGTAVLPAAVQSAVNTTVAGTYINAVNKSIDDLSTYINTSVDGAIAEAQAALNQEVTNRTNADTVLQTSITSLSSTVSNNTAAISSEAVTRANADSALSATINTLSSTVSNNTAAISSEAVTRANADGSLAGTISSLSAGSSAGVATGKMRLSAVSGSGGVATEFSIQLSADSGSSYASTGMRMQAMTDGASRVVFDTSQFLIISGTSGFTPFAVTSGNLISNALVPQSQVTGLGTLATKNLVSDSDFSGQLANAKVAGLGAFATASQINSSNIATYIATAAIAEAYIGSISASKISVSQLSAFTANLGTVTAGLARDANSKFIVDFDNARLTVSD